MEIERTKSPSFLTMSSSPVEIAGLEQDASTRSWPRNRFLSALDMEWAGLGLAVVHGGGKPEYSAGARAGQVPASLQSLSRVNVPQAIFSGPDPYEGPAESNSEQQILVRLLSIWQGCVFPDADLSRAAESFEDALHSHVFVRPFLPREMHSRGGGKRGPFPAKVVASLLGKVDFVGEETANVLLVDEASGERLESRCDLEVLRENGIGMGDEFRCEVVRAGGTTTTRLTKLPPKPVTKEKVREVRARFSGRWNF